MQASKWWMILLAMNATWVWAANGDLGGGTGEPNAPYLIEDFNDFQVFCGDPNYWAEGVVTCLMTDLDLDPNLPGRQAYSEAVFGQSSFAGTFNGKGHCVRNLFLEAEEGDLGLVGEIGEEGAVYNLSIEGCFVRASYGSAGGLCVYNAGMIRGCSVTGFVGGREYAGGLCALNDGLIECCFSTARVTGSGDWDSADFVGGGLCGRMDQGWIRYAYATGPVSGYYVEDSNRYEGVVGGLCGGCDGLFEQCYAVGQLQGDEDIDNGLCGRHSSSHIFIDCFWDVNSTGIESSEAISGCVGLTTVEMQDRVTYLEAGWMQDSVSDGSGHWAMVEGDYPKLNGAAGGVPTGFSRVPQVQGLSVSSAQAALETAGLALRNVVTVPSLTVEANEVAAVAACVHGLVAAGTALDLYVSYGCDANGTEESPWPLACLQDLEAVNLDLSAYYFMSNDLYCPADAWYEESLIASETISSRGISRPGSFRGIFNGNGASIHNLIIITDDNYVGLMSHLREDALILDLSIKNSSIKGAQYVGGLCGYSAGDIRGCTYNGSVVGEEYIGGLCGATCGTVTYCAAIVDVNGGDYVGGLCGVNGMENVSVDSRVSHCYHVGKVNGDDYVAGLCGYQVGEASCLENCLWDVIASGQVSGVVWDDDEPGAIFNLVRCNSIQMFEAQTYLDAGWDLAGESIHGTRDQWTMLETDYPIPVQLDPNFTPYVYVGTGTEDDPYQIANANDLGAMWQEPEACYVLTADLDLEEISWYGPLVESFSGSLDGRGHTLSNLFIEGIGELGVFGTLSGDVENLVIEQAVVSGLGDYVGTICGINNGTIKQCSVDTTVVGYDYVGGICGENANGGYGRGSTYRYYLTDSHTSGFVVGHDYVGGISGGGYASENCSSDCSVAGHKYVGQLVGE